MWFDTDGNVPGEVTKNRLYDLLNIAIKVDVPIYVVFNANRMMLKRKLTHYSHIRDDELWYQDREGTTKRVGTDSGAVIFTNYFYAFAYLQKLRQGGLTDA